MCTMAVALASCGPLAARERLHGTVLPPLPPPALRLVDDHRTPFALSDLRGTTVIVFFGYTHCTEECPEAMTRLAAMRRSLPARDRNRVRVLFVTVDPARDSRSALAAYTKKFDPTFIGLTGSRKALMTAYAEFNVRESADGNRLAHSSAIYVIDSRGHLRELFDPNAPVAGIVADVEALISNS